MADQSLKEARHLAQLTHEQWSRYDQYQGTKEDLIGAGFAVDGQFPGDPGRSPNMVTYDADGVPVGRGNNRRPSGYQIRRSGKTKFFFRRYLSPEVREERMTAYRAEAKHEQAKLNAEKEVEQAAAQLEAMARDGKKHSRQCAENFWTYWRAFLDLHCREDFDEDGYRFDDDTIEDFRCIAAELYQEIRHAIPISDRTNRMNRLARAKIASAKLDEGLQGFLQKLPTLPSLDQEQRSHKPARTASRRMTGRRRRMNSTA